MKLKYLSEEDKQTLRVLRHTTEISEMVGILEQRMKYHPTLHAIWEYRKWFLMLEEKMLKEKPVLVYGLIIVYILSGRLQEAKMLLEQLPEYEKGFLLCRLFFRGMIWNNRKRF